MTTVRRINLDNPMNLFDSVFGSGSYHQLPNIWAEQAKVTGNFPPYNLTKNEDATQYNLTLAVAGFDPEDIDVSVENNKLMIKGQAQAKNLPDGVSYVHKGIAERVFTKEFSLGEYVEVTSVTYENGLLDISLQLRVPEHKKPKKFSIAIK